MTAVHPAANAAPSFRVIMAEGKFQGVKIPLRALLSYHSRPATGYNLHDT